MSHPLSLLGLDHVVLRVIDRAALTDWYVTVLGCRVERVLPQTGLTQLRAGHSLIDLVDAARPEEAGSAPPAPAGHNLDHFCLRLEHIDSEAIQAHLLRHGVPFGAVERRYGADGHGPSLYLQDPEGNRIELKGPPDPDQRELLAEAITGPT